MQSSVEDDEARQRTTTHHACLPTKVGSSCQQWRLRSFDALRTFQFKSVGGIALLLGLSIKTHVYFLRVTTAWVNRTKASRASDGGSRSKASTARCAWNRASAFALSIATELL